MKSELTEDEEKEVNSVLQGLSLAMEDKKET